MNCAITLNLINFCDRFALPFFSIFAKPKTSTKATEKTDIVIIIYKSVDIMITQSIVTYLITEIINFKVYPTLNQIFFLIIIDYNKIAIIGRYILIGN